MKTRVLSIFLILLLCLTAGCGKASQNTEKPDGFSFSESQTEEAAGKDTSQAEQTAPAQPPEAQSAQTADEETEGSAESERRPVPEHPVSGTTPPQTSDPQQKKDESERRSETTASPAPSETEQPIPPATEEPKPSEPPQPTQPWKNKAANGKRVSSSVPFGYVKNPQDKEDWLVDEPAADIVRRVYALCLDGRGPLQIAKQLEQEKVLIPSAYYASLGRKTRKQYTNPYAWDQKTVAGILANQQYTGCTVNFMTTTVSYKVHKTVYKPKDEWQIIPNTQPAIIDEDTWKRVQELRENRIRPTATGRTSLFSGKVFCADCGSKLHFCAAKSLNANQEHYRCANYKSGRGNCQIHYIRNVVLEKIVLEAINSLADFVRCYEPVFLYLMAQKDIVSKRTETNRLKSSIESGKRRIQDLDKLIERIYEDQVLGNISAERYARMSVNYENEQRELVKRVDEDEKRLVSIEQTSLDLKTLLKVLRSNTAFEELTPTLVNSLIRRIEVHNNDKSSGHCSVKVDIYFTAIGLIDIPTEDEIKSLMEKIQSNPQEYRLTA